METRPAKAGIFAASIFFACASGAGGRVPYRHIARRRRKKDRVVNFYNWSD